MQAQAVISVAGKPPAQGPQAPHPHAASAASSPVGWTWDRELSGPDSLLVSQGLGDHQELDSSQRQVEGLTPLTTVPWPCL